MRHYLLTGLLTAKNDGGARGLCLLMLSSPVSGSWGGLSTGVPHGVSRVSLSIRWIFHRSSDNFLKLGRKFANTIQCGGSKVKRSALILLSRDRTITNHFDRVIYIAFLVASAEVEYECTTLPIAIKSVGNNRREVSGVGGGTDVSILA